MVVNTFGMSHIYLSQISCYRRFNLNTMHFKVCCDQVMCSRLHGHVAKVTRPCVSGYTAMCARLQGHVAKVMRPCVPGYATMCAWLRDHVFPVTRPCGQGYAAMCARLQQAPPLNDQVVQAVCHCCRATSGYQCL